MQETYNTIFNGNPALPATAEVPALPAPTEVSGLQAAPPLVNSNNTPTTDNVIPIGWFHALEPPIALPPPPLPNSVVAADTNGLVSSFRTSTCTSSISRYYQ